MSNLIMMGFTEDSKLVFKEYFRNSFGGAPRIWKSVCEAYLRRSFDWNGDDTDMWALLRNPIMEDHDRMVLGSTLDCAVVRRVGFQDMADSFKLFDSRYPTESNISNHLLAEAEFIEEKVIPNSDIAYIAWNLSDICDDDWSNNFGESDNPFEDDPEDCPCYDFSKGNKHFFL